LTNNKIQKNLDVSLVPDWEVADKCVDCDKEPTVLPTSQKELIELENATKCDGFGSFAISNHST
jgi:hypothetical protein